MKNLQNIKHIKVSYKTQSIYTVGYSKKFFSFKSLEKGVF